MSLLPVVLVSVPVIAVVVALVTRPVRGWLIRKGVYDRPTSRSSHDVVKPRGGGLAVLMVVVPAWLGCAWAIDDLGWPLGLAFLAVGLAGLSFIDDLRGISPAIRFPAQLLAVVLGLLLLDPGLVFQGLLPVWLDATLAALLWLWFVNLYNFMDGIDGLTAVETVSLGVGLALVGWIDVPGQVGSEAALSWFLAAGAAGFLYWNWAPSKIFLGDVGSVPIGFLLGALLLEAAASGLWAAALILPGYYLADATITLGRRLVRLEPVWRAHREHAYQRAVQRGETHARVALKIAGLNVALLGCALWATYGEPVMAVALAVGLSLAVWISLQWPWARYRYGSRP